MDEAKLKAFEALTKNPEEMVKTAARKRLQNFSRYVQPDLVLEPFHQVYYKVLDMFAHGKIKKLIISMPPQHGKQISDNENVATLNGFVRHGDLKIGDYVFGRNGKPKKVLWVSEKTKSEYVINFSDGSSVECHGNHLWTVIKDRQRELIINTNQLSESKLISGVKGKRGSRYHYQVDSNVCVEFESKEILIDPYTLGAWLGDGKSSTPMLFIGMNDVEIIDNIPYLGNEQKGSTCRNFYFSELGVKLKELELLNNKNIPKDYIFNSIEVRKQLIAGLIDTDGFVYQKNGRVTISNTNKSIIDSAALILRSLGQSVVVCDYEPKESSSGIIGKKKVYQLCFNPTIYFPTVVPRKKIKKLSVNKKRSIISVEKKDNLGWGNCIEVEDSIYLVGETFIPTHNSEGSSRKLPAFMLGLNPNLKISICSYGASLARDFNRDIQKIIDTREYRELFPETFLNNSNAVTMSNTYLRNSDVIEMVGKKGSLRVLGRGGALTGKSIDISILDDLYKDYAEGNSPVVREAAWKMYTTVIKKRLHNDSQELIVFTRWHDQDLIGRIEKKETIINAETWQDFENIPKGAWIRINFQAIKEDKPTELDNRPKNTALWEGKHSLEKLESERSLDPVQFQCLNQGDAGSAEGKLYQPFKTWVEKSDFGTYIRSGNYTDVADEGSDSLFSGCYDIYKSNNMVFNEKTKRFEPLLFALITDVILTEANTEVTSITVPAMINKNGTQTTWIESNAGGSQFANTVSKKVKSTVNKFYQSGNKESRIVTASAMVNQHIIMPFGWEHTFKDFHDHVTSFLRNFDANTHDDAEDGLTGIYEKEIADGNIHPYNKVSRGVKLRN
jgi:predicted phage terminase large subunit-like protein